MFRSILETFTLQLLPPGVAGERHQPSDGHRR